MALPMLPADGDKIERVLIQGDLSALTADERLSYYRRVCDSLGLNPYTQPFDYLKLSGKTVLYAKRDAAEQLRKIHGVSITAIETQHFEGVYIVTAKASDRTGRTDASTGVVPLGTLKGEALANALMKAETKAKRRVTLSICGLGMLDETEVTAIPGAVPQETVYRVVAPAAAAETVSQEPEIVPVVGEGAPVTIKSFSKKSGAIKGVVVLSTGEELPIFSEPLAALAEQCCQDVTPIRADIKISASGKARLDGLQCLVAQNEAELSLPLTVEDIWTAETLGLNIPDPEEL